MTGTTRLVARLGWADARRGGALAAGAVTAVGFAGLLLQESSRWVGHWYAFALAVQIAAPPLLALAAVFAAWQAGRDRRRGTVEAVMHGARPRWQSALLSWAVLSVSAGAGFLLAVGVLATLFVARFASYTGTGWIPTTVMVLPALGAATALGCAVGTFLRGRLVAPLLGVAVYAGILVLQHDGGGPSWLVLGSYWPGDRTARVPTGVTALQVAWFAGVAVVLLAIAAVPRPRRAAAVLPVLLAAGLAGVLLTGSIGPDHYPHGSVTDVRASQAVCEQHGRVRVCLARENAFLQPTVGPQVAALLSRLAAVPGGPTTVVDWDIDRNAAPRPGVVFIDPGGAVGLDGVHDTTWASLGNDLWSACRNDSTATSGTTTAVLAWARHRTTLGDGPDPYPAGTRVLRGLDALSPTLQRAWMIRYFAMSHACDNRLAARLADPADTPGWR